MVGAAIAVGVGMEVFLHPWLIDGSPPGIGVTIAVAIAAARATGLLETARAPLEQSCQSP
jgi:hypothetical protein